MGREYAPTNAVLIQIRGDFTAETELEKLRRLADGGDPQALRELGYRYYFGLGVESDKRKSRKYYKQAYECAKRALKKDGGNAYAKFCLGMCLCRGDGYKNDEKKGVELIEEAAEAGLKAAQFEIVYEYDEQDEKLGDSLRIRKILEELGEKGDAEDKRRVAVLYKSLKSCRDKERFAYWYERAAQEGCAEVQFNLAEDCRHAKDYKKSIYWFKRAAENGYMVASYELARFYYEGIAVEKNYAKALELLLPLARCTHGDTDLRRKGAAAAKLIGDIFSNGGFGVERDLKKALTWYMGSVSHRCREELEAIQAYTRIGDAYFYGLGVEQDYSAAVKWYRQAIFNYDYEAYNDAGYVNYDYEANVKLGDCYRLGLGVEKDEKEAFRLYKEVTKKTDGYHPANERVAQCYYFGTGVEKDEEKAREFWEYDAEEGNEEAKAALKKYFPEE